MKLPKTIEEVRRFLPKSFVKGEFFWHRTNLYEFTDEQFLVFCRLYNANSPQHDVTQEMTDVQIGRLQRKIEKLQKQRDHYKTELAHYQRVMELQPFLLSRYKSYEREKVERDKNMANAERVIEQEQLIKRLLKESTTGCPLSANP